MAPRDTALAALLPFLVTTVAVTAISAREPRAAERESVSCEREGLVRRVTLRADPGPDRVCDVLHEKPDDTSEVLWAAPDDPGHCEFRYEQFVRQLASRGWTCGWASAPPAARTAVTGGANAGNTGSQGGAGWAERAKDVASCELGGLTRRVLLRTNPSPDRVCDVFYEKPDEGDTHEVLWAARHDFGYCEPKYERFVRQLVSDGWACERAQASDEMQDKRARIARPGDSAATVAGLEGLLIEPRPSPSPAKPSPAGTESPSLARTEAPLLSTTETPSPSVSDSQDELADVIRTASESQAARRVLRDWCIAEAGDGAERAERQCDCLSETLVDYGLSKKDAQAIADGLPAPRQVKDGTIAPDASRSERLNALAMNYGYVVDACD